MLTEFSADINNNLEKTSKDPVPIQRVAPPLLEDSSPWSGVKQNLSRYQRKEKELLSFLKKDFPKHFGALTHIPQNSPADGLKGDFWSASNGNTYELKVDSYSARTGSGAIFIEYCKTDLRGNGLIPTGLATTRAEFHMFPVCDGGVNNLLIVPTKFLLMMLMRFEFDQRDSAVGVNGNIGQMRTSGLLVSIEKLKEYATLNLPLPKDFFARWNSWGGAA